MKRDLVKLVGSILMGGVAILVALAACGGSTAGTTSVPPAPPATATAQASSAAAPTPTATAVPSPTLSLAPTPTTGATLFGQGKLVFEKTAGGVGCAFCHGPDGKGGGISGLGAPDIRGAKEAKVRGALIGGVPLMSFIKLSDEEITAVVAYLQYLNEQP